MLKAASRMTASFYATLRARPKLYQQAGVGERWLAEVGPN